MRHLLIAILLLCAAFSCRESSERQPVDDRRILRPRRFHPPPARVRAVPPHNVHARGMGPYELGASLKEVLDLLPHGPRVELLAIEELFDYNLVRAEGDKLLIGAARADGVEFVAALDPEVARSDEGVGVGTSVEELDRALGDLSISDVEARDPRLRVYPTLPNVRFVVEEGAVGAMVVVPGAAARDGGDQEEEGGDSAAEEGAEERDAGAARAVSVCGARDRLRPHEDELASASGIQAGDVRIAYGCFEFGFGALVYRADQVVLVAPEAEAAERQPVPKLRRVGVRTVPGLVYAAPIEADGEGGQEVAVVRSRESGASQVVRVEVYRVDGGRFSAAGGEDVYRLAASAAAWVGARLDDVGFLVELEARSGGLEVGGFYLQRAGGAIRNLVPLEPKKLPVRRRRGARAPPDSGPEDAGARQPPLLPPPPDASAGR